MLDNIKAAKKLGELAKCKDPESKILFLKLLIENLSESIEKEGIEMVSTQAYFKPEGKPQMLYEAILFRVADNANNSNKSKN